MKKKIGMLLCLLFLFLLITGCEERGDKAPTTYAPERDYEVGEEIEIKDSHSGEVLGRVRIENVKVIAERPITIQGTEYEAIAWMLYSVSTADSEMVIDSSNFEITDVNGARVRIDPPGYENYTDYRENSVVFALKEKGDHVTIKFRYHTEQSPIAFITAQYGETPSTPVKDVQQSEEAQQPKATEKNASVIERNKKLKWLCFWLGGVIVALTIVLIKHSPKKEKEKILLLKERRHDNEIIRRTETS